MWTKKERSSARWERDLDVKKRKYHEDTEKKRQAVEMRYHDKKESIKQYKNKNIWKIRHQTVDIRKQSIREILKCSWYITLRKSVHIRSYSGLYFPAFGPNKERYGVSLRIQSECRKIRTRITPNTDTFHAV